MSVKQREQEMRSTANQLEAQLLTSLNKLKQGQILFDKRQELKNRVSFMRSELEKEIHVNELLRPVKRTYLLFKQFAEIDACIKAAEIKQAVYG